MELVPGTLLGPYRIVTAIGAGGMGTVYRAHDTRLGRDVIVKVSRGQFTERFGREARAIAALNHSNVCHLYDVGPNYLVMELVEGEPLRGPLALDQAIPVLRQLIDGIEAAHEKGINQAGFAERHPGLDHIMAGSAARHSAPSPLAPSHLAPSHLVPLWWQSAFTSPDSCRAFLLRGTMVGSAGLPR